MTTFPKSHSLMCSKASHSLRAVPRYSCYQLLSPTSFTGRHRACGNWGNNPVLNRYQWELLLHPLLFPLPVMEHVLVLSLPCHVANTTFWSLAAVPNFPKSQNPDMGRTSGQGVEGLDSDSMPPQALSVSLKCQISPYTFGKLMV